MRRLLTGWLPLPAVLVSGCVASACGSGASPPLAKERELEVVQPRSTIYLGDKDRLTARWSDGSSVDTAVSWTAFPIRVLAVDEDGQVLGISMGEAAVIAEAEGKTAASRVLVVPNPRYFPRDSMSGLWNGTASMTDCEKLAGQGPDPCKFLRGTSVEVTLRLLQDGNRLTGTMSILNTAGPVSGWRDIAGRHVLYGRLRVTGRQRNVRWLVESDLRCDARVRLLTGTLTLADEMTNNWGLQIIRSRLTIERMVPAADQ
jgi:hypothetical protein